MYLVTLYKVHFNLNQDIHTVSQANEGNRLNEMNNWPHFIDSVISPTIAEAAKIIAKDLIELYFNPTKTPKASYSLIPLESIDIALNYEKIKNQRCQVPISLKSVKTFKLSHFLNAILPITNNIQIPTNTHER